MLSAGHIHRQARHICIALGCSQRIEALLSCFREFSSSSLNATTAASAAHSRTACAHFADLHRSVAASLIGRSEPVIVGFDRLADAGAGLASLLTGRSSAASPFGPPECLANRSGLAIQTCVPVTSVRTLGTAPLLPGRRMYHQWYYGTKLRNRVITSASSLDQLGKLIRQEGQKLDHVNLATFLKQLQLLATTEADKAGTAASTSSSSSKPGTGKMVAAAAVAASSSRAVKQQVAALTEAAAQLVRKRTKWFDPRNAAAVVYYTAALGYTNDRLLHNMTARMVARLNEAYSRDLLLMLRGMARHAKLSAAAAAATTTTTAANSSSSSSGNSTTAVAGSQLTRAASRQLTLQRLNRYPGPPVQLLECVEQFLCAKVPTGRMPPENIDGLMRHLLELPRGPRPISRKLLRVVEADLRVRMKIYAPKPLSGVLSVLASERYPFVPELLDAAADQFAAHGNQHGTGMAAARFLTAASALIQNRPAAAAAAAATAPTTPATSAKPAGSSGSEGAPAPSLLTASTTPAAALKDNSSSSSSSKGPSPGRWLSSRPELLALCLRLMSRDLSGPAQYCVVDWMAALIRAEVPLTSLASAAAAVKTVATKPAILLSALPATASSVPAPAVAAVAVAVAAPATPVAAAAAAFVKAHAAAVEAFAPRLQREAVGKLKKMYDTYGLQYPKGL